MSKLNVVSQASGSLSRKLQFIEKTRVEYERWWSTADPVERYPTLSAMGRVRILRTLELIETKKADSCVDVGCGDGTLAKQLEKRGVLVTLIDVAKNVSKEGVLRQCLPYLELDKSFDMVICTDVLAELDESLHRLAISELANLMKRESRLICSTPLDTDTWRAQEKFLALLKTEFEIIKVKKSYHRLLLLIKKFINSFDPNEKMLFFLEKVSELFFADRGVTHVICVAKRRKLF